MTKRITVPEGHVAVLLTNDQAGDMQSLLINIRLRFGGKPALRAEYTVAGELLLALMEANHA